MGGGKARRIYDRLEANIGLDSVLEGITEKVS